MLGAARSVSSLKELTFQGGDSVIEEGLEKGRSLWVKRR